MKTKQPVSGYSPRQGFTLLELMVSMSITLILLGVVTYLTGMSTDTYRTSRDEVRSARQAKEALDAMGRDFEAMVMRSDGNNFMWLYAGEESFVDKDEVELLALKGPVGKEITNTCQLIFFTGAPDRYDGDITGAADSGGDVSAVGYRLVYRDQISNLDPDDDGAHPVFSLYRHMVNPDETFSGKKNTGGNHVAERALLGVTDLKTVWETGSRTSDPPSYISEDFSAQNMLVENIYELTVTFIVQADGGGVQRITIGPGANHYHAFKLMGNGLLTVANSGDADVALDGKLVAVEVSITVLSDQGLVLAQKSGIARGEIIAEHGHHFTKTINVPRL